MFRRLDDFLSMWPPFSDGVGRLLAVLDDASLATEVAPGHRTLGRIAWHVVTSLPEMAARVGLRLAGPDPEAPVPASAAAIAEAWRQASGSLVAELQTGWTDATLQVEDDMYGERWSRGRTLFVLVVHTVHHVGQMTVLARQAGLRVPGLFGPAREDWAAYGMAPPAV